MQAHLGTTVAGFPNMFIVPGPNTGLGHTSMVVMIESQIAYVLDSMRVMDELGAGAVDVRPEVQAAYNDAVQEDMQGHGVAVRLRQLVPSTRRAATARSGPGSPSASGGAPAALTRRTTSCAGRCRSPYRRRASRPQADARRAAASRFGASSASAVA